ncbi:MAG TPA: hypothetical protein VFI29_04910 [Hanamia sp.]|nr:hypothetical protein [Hanamia sp.]
MKLQVNRATKIKEVQKEFSEVYPFLKIEFYKKPHAEKELTHKKFRLNPDKILSKESKSFNPSEIDIRKSKTVAELEKEVYEKLGIAMQVSRKSGNIWLETSFTDDRTLEMQNQQGQAMSIA